MAEMFEPVIELAQFPDHPVVEISPRDDGRVVEVIVPVNEAALIELQAYVTGALADLSIDDVAGVAEAIANKVTSGAIGGEMVAPTGTTQGRLADLLVALAPAAPGFRAAFGELLTAFHSGLPTTQPSGAGWWSNGGQLTYFGG